jgi:sigma-B regulation protein RsbU (phosphoserine phosphatase)
MIPLHPGDVYLFFTDGISEAMNEGAEFFGEIALARLLERCAHLGAEDLLECVLGEITTFVGAALPQDDMTMIMLKIDGPGVPRRAISSERAEIVETRA